MGKNYALCIGINKYNNLKNLEYAQQDAELLQSYFLNHLKIRAEDIYLFSHDAPDIKPDRGQPIKSKPSFTNLKYFFRKRFEHRFLSGEDNFWFFFAGHGKRYKNRDYLMPFDADPGDIESTAIPIHDITEKLRGSGAGNVMLFIDACRNDDRRDGLGIGEEHQKGVITFFSCSPGESSYEISELRQGSFSYILLEAMGLKKESHCATVENLNQYLKEFVPKLNQKYGKPVQNPYTVVEPIEKNHLILFPDKATKNDLDVLKLDATQAELDGNLDNAKALWKRILQIDSTDERAWKNWERIHSGATRKEFSSSTIDSEKKDRGIDVNSEISDLFQNFSEMIDEALPQIPDKEASKASVSFVAKIVKIDAYGLEVDNYQRPIICHIEKLSDDVFIELAHIPTGSFIMGSPKGEEGRAKNERPQRQVNIQSFWMGRYPITQSQWQVVSSLTKVNLDLPTNPSEFKGASNPVEGISWYEALEFCARLSSYSGRKYRLPTESEWEYACRAETSTPFHFGETVNTDLASYFGEASYGNGAQGISYKSTNSVTWFPYCNHFGLSEMHGNVLEWCQDIWHYNYDEAPVDGQAWNKGGDEIYRVTRGGSWSQFPSACRSASRNPEKPDTRYNALGFRIVMCNS